MIRTHYSTQSGFSAVELLITLFIAAAFIGTGTQIYSVVIQNSDEARTRAKASNIAYENLQRYAPKATNPCTSLAANPTPTIPADSGLTNTAISVNTTCPYGATPTSKVTVSVKYDTPQKEIIHVLFVTN
jgi:Tfp pilus assembly protein PilV